LEAAVDEVMPPEEYALEITIHAQVPAGASTGTSAAVTVVLIDALIALTPGRMTPHEVAFRSRSNITMLKTFIHCRVILDLIYSIGLRS